MGVGIVGEEKKFDAAAQAKETHNIEFSSLMFTLARALPIYSHNVPLGFMVFAPKDDGYNALLSKTRSPLL